MTGAAPDGTVVLAGRLWAEAGRGAVMRDAALHIADGRIERVVSAPQTEASNRLMAMPAVVNAHDHGYGLRPMAFGVADDALEVWISALRARPRIDPYLEAVVAFARMARAGIGTTVHCHNSHNAELLVDEAAEVARAAKDVGIRVAFSCPIVDRNAWVYGGIEAIRSRYSASEWAAVSGWRPTYAPAAEQLARVEAVASAHQSDMFNVQYGPIGPQWCEDATLESIAEACERTGRRVHMHLLESPRQRDWTDRVYPEGIVRHLDSIGFLTPRLTVAHGVWLTEAECALLAERGVMVAVNTSSNLRLRSGLAPVPVFHREGVRFALGLDGMAFDEDQDALRDLRLAYHLHAGTTLEPQVPASAFLEAAFANGAAAFDGDETQGRLAPGCRADFICLDYAAMSHDVLADSAGELTVFMNRVHAGYLKTLCVAGRIIVEDGELLSVDLPALEREMMAQASRGEAALRRDRKAIHMHREKVRDFYRDEGKTRPRPSPA